MGFPAIVPSTVFGQNAPSNRINVGAIGMGRISRASRPPGACGSIARAHIVAVCDLDANRVEHRQALVNGLRRKRGKPYDRHHGPTRDYRELLANKDIDAS